jgi:hypothetical protein
VHLGKIVVASARSFRAPPCYPFFADFRTVVTVA